MGDNLNYGWYNLIIVIDEDQYLDSESDTSNNKYVIPMEYISSWTTSAKIKSKKPILISTIDSKNIKPYDINIYNFSGILLKSVKINFPYEEKNIIKELPSGLYIINSPFETKKVLK